MKKLLLILTALFLDRLLANRLQATWVWNPPSARSEERNPEPRRVLFHAVQTCDRSSRPRDCACRSTTSKPQTNDKITLADLDVEHYVQIDPAHAPDIMTRWPGDLTHEKNEDGYRIGFNYVTPPSGPRSGVHGHFKRGSATGPR